MSISETILEQLGGQKFVAMTGCKNLRTNGNDLIINLPKNKSKANLLKIKLVNDLYNMEFLNFNKKTCNIKTIENYNCVYAEQLKGLFESVTGFYTSL